MQQETETKLATSSAIIEREYSRCLTQFEVVADACPVGFNATASATSGTQGCDKAIADMRLLSITETEIKEAKAATTVCPGGGVEHPYSLCQRCGPAECAVQSGGFKEKVFNNETGVMVCPKDLRVNDPQYGLYVADVDTDGIAISDHCIEETKCTSAVNKVADDGKTVEVRVSKFEVRAGGFGLVAAGRLREIEEAVETLICPPGQPCNKFPVDSRGQCLLRKISSADCNAKASQAAWRLSLLRLCRRWRWRRARPKPPHSRRRTARR